MTLTFTDIPLEVDAALQRRARQQHTTVDQVALAAMKTRLGLGSQGSEAVGDKNLAVSIRERFAPMGGIEIVEPIRDPMRNPPDFSE